ncbi:Rhs-family protein, partial [Olavius algarvensis Delta 1 endosymbiont]
AGEVVWTAEYEPFGAVDVGSRSGFANNFRFSGHYFDEETGLHYNYHRYYDPKAGRYLTPDPNGLLGGINLYSYAGNNPINAVDPFGLAEYIVAWSTASGTFGVGGLTMSGMVIDPRPIRSKTDGSIVGYHVLKFRGAFIGGSVSPPVSWSTNVAIFEDDLPNPDLFNIEGDSLINNNCPGSKTHFGKLIFQKYISSRGFNFELFSGFAGNIEAARSSSILSKNGYDKMVGGKH